MEAQSFIKEMKTINGKLHSYLCSKEPDFQELIKIIEDTKVLEDAHKLREILHIMSCTNQIYNDKVNNILSYLLDSIKRNFSSEDLYSITSNNQIMLQFFIKHDLITQNRLIILKLLEKGQYFCINKGENEKKEKIHHKKAKDETDNKIKDEEEQIEKKYREICEIIKKDLIDEFISYVSKNNFPISEPIYDPDEYIYLISEQIPIIEYVAKFGSIQIFKYLLTQNIELTSNLWNLAIESGSLEMIQILVERKVIPESEDNEFSDDNYAAPYVECIKNSRFEIANYIKNNFIGDKNIDKKILSYILPTHNYDFIPDDFSGVNNEELFSLLCQNDYAFLVNHFLKEIDVKLCQKVLIESIKYQRIEIVKLLLTKPNLDVNQCQTYILKN